MPGLKLWVLRGLRFSFFLDDDFCFNPSYRGSMNASPRAAAIRISILIVVLCAVSFGWEAYRNSGLLHLSGRVIGEGRVLGGKGGDNKEFTIRYRVQGEDFSFISRRGILDQLGGLRGLRRGDTVPLAVSPSAAAQGDFGHAKRAVWHDAMLCRAGRYFFLWLQPWCLADGCQFPRDDGLASNEVWSGF